MDRFRNWLTTVFNFSRKESNGFLVLSFLIVLALLAPKVVDLLLQSNEPLQPVLIEELPVTELLKKDSVFKAKAYSKKPVFTSKTLFTFDPNTASSSDFLNLGFAPWLAERIEKYRSKGGKFRTKKDLGKIYGMKPDFFERLKPFISLPDSLEQKSKFADKKFPTFEKRFPEPKPIVKFDLNTADTMQLMGIFGIGRGLSNRIVRYRTRLGGFHANEQVREVFGLDSSVVDELFKKAEVKSSTAISKLKINKMTLEEISSHPYITKRYAKIIINYRNQHGPYKQASDLLKTSIFPVENVEKLKPYLDFEE